MMRLNFFTGLVVLITSTCAVQTVFSQQAANPLEGKVICLDPGHGGTALTDSYRVGPGGEREEWINLRVALMLQEMLQEKGARVIMTRTEDKAVSLDERAALAMSRQADLFISIHHNATADPGVNFPIIYFHGNVSENRAGVAFGRHLAGTLAKHLYGGHTPVSLVSDHAIFPGGGARVLRKTYGIPGVLAEASFFTHPAEEKRLKQPDYNRSEAQAHLEAIEAFFSTSVLPVLPKYSRAESIPPFRVFQEAERMSKIALNWKKDFSAGKKLMQQQDTASLRKAYELFTRSVRSFPDSYLARKCHEYRAILLKQLGRKEEARLESIRAQEFYMDLP